MQSPLHDNQIDLLRSGEEPALQYFMNELGESLRFFAYKITSDKDVSEEIVSEAFFKLWQGRQKVASFQSLKSFLYIVTRNACYDYTGSSLYRNRAYPDETFLSGRQNGDADILSQMIRIELISQIVMELEKLPKQQAEIFKMTYLEGKETKEISRELNTTVSNVYFARSKAIAYLKSVFKEKDFGFYLSFIVWLYYK